MNPASVIAEAKRWVGNWPFTEIESVTWLPENWLRNGEKIPNGIYPALWWPQTDASGQRTARITFNWDVGIDSLWHEVFHSVTDQAPLIQKEPLWKEGWCCAFSEVMRQEFVIKDLAVPPWSEIQRRYSYACTALLNYVGRDAEYLQELWISENHVALKKTSRQKSFSMMVGYDPETGTVPRQAPAGGPDGDPDRV